MKNKLSDVRDYLVQALEDLSDKDVTPEQMQQTIERAKTISQVSGTYIQAVKIEVDAIRMAYDTGRLPSAEDAGQKLIEGN